MAMFNIDNSKAKLSLFLKTQAKHCGESTRKKVNIQSEVRCSAKGSSEFICRCFQ